MPWESSDRRSRLPADWARRVSDVMKRDGGRCRAILPRSKKRCPRKATDVDHIRPGDDHSLSNLQALCEEHHKRKTAAENRRAKAKIRSSRYRAAEEHPGRVR